MTALDSIEVTVDHGAEVLTLDVEITAWPTRATLEHPGDPAEWRCVTEGLEEVWRDPWLTKKLEAAINDQVQEHCAGQAAPEEER